MKIKSIILGPIDVLHGTCWLLGSLVRSFEMGREGYLPSFSTETGKQIIQQARKGREERQKESGADKTHQPIGFY